MLLTYLENASREQKVPLITLAVKDYLVNLIQSAQLQSVLEIGAGIGYSSYAMSQFATYVVTYEKDPVRSQFLADFLTQNKITKIELRAVDALFDPNPLTTKFDLIFIDAAKSKYIEFFQHFAPLLAPGGYIVTDNLFFHHLDPEKVKKGTAKMINKIRAYEAFLQDHPDYTTVILPIGDGLAVTRAK